ncbi:TPA: helix-turn-helix domain-containing protein [Bacillus paranthracis]|uniref:phage terminase small subunit n=1 Tax=Bacillus thuringiensis TaxID=1428 RepID=UPI00202B02CE|nr:phage terminase small subunit [Bacillus thuringiensis]UQM92355.1 phage terminase small subunit [Bacillus thuringiensis]HDR7526737.1 helix-turn-helix domain-containing protein [Bacillus paranthracis]
MKQKHELAQEDYMQGMKYKDIAEKHDVSVNTVKSWKTRYKWNRKGVHTNNEKVRTQKKTGAPVGNKNAVGNSGNKNPKWGNKNAVGHGPPKGNDNATTHGLFKKIIPNDDPHAMELLEEIQNHTGLDMLFHSIQLQYFNILNSQRIMHVRDKDDMSKEVISESEGGEAYMVQFAWDKQANLLTAYARAMNTLTSMIEKFNKLADVDDERRLKLEQMKLGIEKTKAEVEKLSGNENDGPIEIIVKRKGDD